MKPECEEPTLICRSVTEIPVNRQWQRASVRAIAIPLKIEVAVELRIHIELVGKIHQVLGFLHFRFVFIDFEMFLKFVEDE